MVPNMPTAQNGNLVLKFQGTVGIHTSQAPDNRIFMISLRAPGMSIDSEWPLFSTNPCMFAVPEGPDGPLKILGLNTPRLISPLCRSQASFFQRRSVPELRRARPGPRGDRAADFFSPCRCGRHASLVKSRMRKRACTDLCGGRSAMVIPTATVTKLPPV